MYADMQNLCKIFHLRISFYEMLSMRVDYV